MTEPARTRITHRDYRCRGPLSHAHRFRITHRTNGDATTSSFYEALQPGRVHIPRSPLPLPIPLCPLCDFLCDDAAEFTGFVAVPESERFSAWLSPDGERLSVPGNRDASMPKRYVSAGYMRVEARGTRDLDRLDAIRARQTGNDAYNEMNYNPTERQWREDAPYDPDDMTSEI